MKALIFDFDGTIADSFEIFLKIFEEITGRQLTDEEITSLRGESLKSIIKYLQIRRWQIPRLVLKAKKLIAASRPAVKTFSGVPAMLVQLHSSGHPMFILSTNSSQSISEFLKKNRLENCFAGIYGDIGLRSKASALKRIIKKERLTQAECVYIGDEMRDIEAARKAGITSVGVTWGFNDSKAIALARPNFTAKTPGDLARYLTS